MIIYINRQLVQGPWGGGNKFLAAFVNMCEALGHQIVYKLNNDVDILFCMDPRQGSTPDLASYAEMHEFRQTQAAKGKAVKLVQRVGDIGMHGKPDLFALALTTVRLSDLVIFPSEWARNEIASALSNLGLSLSDDKTHIIKNGPANTFLGLTFPKNHLPSSISFVTHHWSTNALKGFEMYEMIDKWCHATGHKFTYIGRVPPDIKLTNALGVMTDKQLAVELRKHDIYVTASKFETGANHVLEAIACQLPVVFHEQGGSIAEYCSMAHGSAAFSDDIKSFERAALIVKNQIELFNVPCETIKTMDYTALMCAHLVVDCYLDKLTSNSQSHWA